LHIVGIPVFLIKPEKSIGALLGSAIASLTQVYLEASEAHTGLRKLRFKDLLENIGVAELCNLAHLSFPAAPSIPARSKPLSPIGIHPQKQPNLSYIGIALPLGRLEPDQLHGLADLAEQYGDSTLRLTPCQNLLLPNVPNASISQVQQHLDRLGLSYSPTHIHSALIACAGNTCASSATDTQAHALALADYLHQHIALDEPLTIHFSGCPKSCAHHSASDMTLVGTLINQREFYQLYVGTGDHPFGRELYPAVSPLNLTHLILRFLQVYQRRRISNETFRAFCDRHSLETLRQWIDPNPGGEH
jgi:ferredoxin-nitrite reductase